MKEKANYPNTKKKKKKNNNNNNKIDHFLAFRRKAKTFLKTPAIQFLCL